MAFRIATELLDLIRAEAAASPGVEVCGLLLGRGDRVAEVRPCYNIAAEPSRAFEIDGAALIAAHRAARTGGPGIMGCYHSHPSGSADPSATDAAMAEPNGWLWLIVAGDAIKGWHAAGGGRRRFDEVPLAG